MKRLFALFTIHKIISLLRSNRILLKQLNIVYDDVDTCAYACVVCPYATSTQHFNANTKHTKYCFEFITFGAGSVQQVVYIVAGTNMARSDGWRL